jgi:hypothetical protein
VQVVEHEQHRPLGAVRAQRGPDRLEQAVAGELGLVRGGRGGGRAVARVLRQDAGQLGAVRRRDDRLERHPRVIQRAVERLHERLVRTERLLVAAPVEHERPVRVRPPRRLGGAARLADAGLAAQQHEAGVPLRRGGPRGLDRGQLGVAPDQRRGGRRGERRGERQLQGRAGCGLGGLGRSGRGRGRRRCP